MIDKQESSPAPIDGQFRHATVLFSDLSGYTELIRKMCNRLELIDRMSDSLERVARQIVSKHRGIVNEVRGDGIVALFGLPGHGEFDVRDAIEAAIDLHDAVHEMSNTDILGGLGTLQMHSGIHSGFVLMKRGTHDNRLYRVTGAAIIVAARISDDAATGEIIVSAESLRGNQAFFDTRDRGKLDIPKLGPVETIAIVGRSDIRRQFDARVRRGLSQFVGRKDALAQLDTALDVALHGQLYTVGIVGIGGVGKTRVAEEYLTRTYAENVRVLRGYCTGPEKSVPMQPFVQILQEVLNIDSSATLDEAANKASREFAKQFPKSAKYADAVLQLLSLDRSGTPTSQTSDDLGREMVRAVVTVLTAIAKTQLLVLFFDDWQWADEPSGKVVATLVDTARTSSILLIAASRELRIGAGIRKTDALIELEGLTESEACTVAKSLLPGVPDLGIIEAIYQQTGGVPLYIEELCQTGPNLAFDDGSYPNDDSEEGTPYWVSRLIESRYDNLSNQAKLIVSVASTVGLVIPSWLLKILLEEIPSVDSMAELADAGLLYFYGSDGQIKFKHGITRDVIYRLVDFERRRDLHSQVARAIESHTGSEQLEEHFEALAYHYSRAENFEKGIDFAERAADKARSRASLDGARVHYQDALNLLDRLEQTREVNARRTSISRNWALVCMYSPAAGQVERFKQQIVYAQKIGDNEGVARAQYFVGYLSYTLGKHNDAREYFVLAQQAAQMLGMTNLSAEIFGGLGHSASARGESVEALNYLDAALELWAKHPSPRGLPVGEAYSFACKGMTIANMGDFEQGHGLIEQALMLMKGSNHQIEGSIYCFRGATLLWENRWHETFLAAESARMIGQRVNGPFIFAMASAIGSYAQWMMERSTDSLNALNLATKWIEDWGIGLYLSLVYGWLIDALITAGRHKEASEYFRRIYEERSKEGEHLGATLGARALARAAAQLESSHLKSAEFYIDYAKDIAKKQQSAVETACNLLREAEIIALSGKKHDALNMLSLATQEFQRMGMSRQTEIICALETKIRGA